MTDVATKTTEVYRLVAELSPEDRRRVFSAVGALCGDVDHSIVTSGQSTPPPAGDLGGLPAKAARWLTQNKISMERIEEYFHIDGDEVELILGDMPGRSKREQTANCYLMLGVRSLLASGEPTVAEAQAVALCKKYKCYDNTNHSTYRKQSANYLAGDREKGFVLSAPGLRAAADMIRNNQ